MSDGPRSGRSTDRVSCKSTELKRCSMIEMRWNKYEVSLASPVWTQIRRPSSEIKFRVVIIIVINYVSTHESASNEWHFPLILVMTHSPRDLNNLFCYLLYQYVEQGTIEMLLAGAICGFGYALFSGQPLTIIGATGPLLVFESIVFQICE